MSKHIATTTQQQHPGRAVARTVVSNVLSVILAAGVVLPVVATIVGEELGEYVGDDVVRTFVVIGGAAAAVSAALTRIMAIPKVDAWLKHVGLASAPDA